MLISNRDFAERLLAWFDRHGRHDLPWQHPRTPYRVWVSEIMLQQTQVGTVVDYFNRFMLRFPSLGSLAAAPLDEVLSLWSGLGYYARARNLHAAAQVMVQRGVPDTLTGWQALPGVGPSTAAAIMAQAFGVPETILDGNVKRVISRHAGVDQPIEQAATIKTMNTVARSYTPRNRAADYTQAIMDLGATVCIRSTPLCAACPVAEDCVALATRRVADLPVRRKRQPVPTRRAVFVAFEDELERLMLVRRPPKGIWGGLWCLPEYDPKEHDPKQSQPGANQSKKQGRACEGAQPLLSMHRLQRRAPAVQLTAFKHRFTHYVLDARIDCVAVSRSPVADENQDVLWLPLAGRDERASQLGLPKPMARFLSEYPALKSTVRKSQT